MLKVEAPSDSLRSSLHSQQPVHTALELSQSRKRELSPERRSQEPPSKRQTKWSEEEDELVTMLRAEGMKWEDIAKRVRGRSSISCRLHYQNFLERKARWDEERKNKLARLYERFKQSMWEPVAKELKMPWRACEDMHWKMGKQQMADRAGANVFTSVDSAQPRDSTPASGHYMLSGPMVPVQSFSPHSPTPAPPSHSYQPATYGSAPPPGCAYPSIPFPALHNQPYHHQPPPSHEWSSHSSPGESAFRRTTNWPPLTYPPRRLSQASETLEPASRGRETSSSDRWSSSRQSRSVSVGLHGSESQRNLQLLYEDRPQLPPLRLTLPMNDPSSKGTPAQEHNLPDLPPYWRPKSRLGEVQSHALPPLNPGPALPPPLLHALRGARPQSAASSRSP